ncbi:MAG: hypothetical protein JWR07_5615 [Nevskia sp.]|nr:hypothetical protein [Nevskia sp.]
MNISMYQASVPVFIRYLGNLRAILEKAASHAEAKKIDPATLVGSRLYPDMAPLSRQIQLASDMAKSAPSRLAGVEPPKFEDTESTFPQLLERIDKTVAHLKSFKIEQIDGSEQRPINLKTANGPLTLNGLPYLTQFLLPNFLFHVTTAYGILRHNGVELGKADYLGTN